jgi:Rrf2 family protein
MLSFSRKTDYALIALAHLAGRAGQIASAREIAETYRLSLSLVMKILKVMQNHRIVGSVRGVKGGYQLAVDLHGTSLYDLIEALKGIEPSDNRQIPYQRPRIFRESLETHLPTEPPLLAVHSKLMRFLKDVKLADLVLPGRRIDVPVEMLSRKTGRTNPNPQLESNVASLLATT